MKWKTQVYQWLNFNLPIIRGSCSLCAGTSPDELDLCHGCRSDLPPNRSACRLCAQPLPTDRENICGSCLRHPPPFRAFAPFLYAPPLDRLIIELKFGDRLYLGRTLGALLAEAAVQRAPEMPQLLVPVPLHPARLRERGYNQAMELARPLRRQLGIPIVDAVERIRATPGQAGLSARERRRNVRGSFKVKDAGVAKGKRVAIVDDVLTTGATAAEMARCLTRAGAASIIVWTLARTQGPD